MTNSSSTFTTALITGASRGLGRALAETLAAGGTRVAMVARQPAPLADVAAAIQRRGGTAIAIAGDVGDKQATHRIVGQATAALGAPIDLVIHNASTLGPTPLRLLLDTECEDLAAVLETNLVGPFRLTKAVAGAMALRGHGTIVHISSDAAIEPYPRWGSYGIAKAAQDQLSRILAAELAGSGVRVVAIDPGEMDTAMHAAAIPDADRATLQRPADVAAHILDIIRSPERALSGARIAVTSWQVAR